MFKKVKQETLDILQEKEARLAELRSESEFAIKLVQDTIGNLEAVNADIQATRDEINTYVQRLNETEGSLSATFARNEQIMQNFKQLLCID